MNFDAELGIDVDADNNVVIAGEHFQTKFPLDDVEVSKEFFVALFNHEYGPYLSTSYPDSFDHIIIRVYAWEMDEVLKLNLTDMILDDIPKDEVDPWILDGYIASTEAMLTALKERRALIKTESYDAR